MMAAVTHDARSPSVSSMPDDIERIKQELLERYESGAPIDIAAWTARFPVYRDELLDYWIWLSGTPRLSEIDKAEMTDPDDRVAEEAIRQACLAVSFGPRWLDEPVDSDTAVEEGLGAELARLRATPYRVEGNASRAFRKAVVYAWIVKELGPRREKVTRLAAQKVAYVLERALNLGLFIEHQQKPLGPYDHKARYRDAEPIAARSGWICVKDASLEAGQVTAQFAHYVQRYIRSETLARRLVECLARLTDEELETWATVSWVGRALVSAGEAVTVDSVRAFLAQSSEWRAKLRRRGFRPEVIAATLARLSRLHLLGD